MHSGNCVVHHTHGVEEKTSVSFVRHVLCIHKFSTVCRDMFSVSFYSCPNLELLAAVSCTKVHNETGNKYKFAQIVQETATNDHKCGCLLGKILPCHSRWPYLFMLLYRSESITFSLA